MTFDAEAGQSVALQVSNIASTPSGQLLNVFVYRPDSPAITASTATYTTIQPTTSQIINLSNLPVSGRYTVILAPRYGVPLSAQVALIPGATGSIPVGEEASSYEANAPGQNVYLSFENGDERADLELALSNVRASGGQDANYTVNVYNESNVQIYGTSCSTTNPGSGCRLPLWYLSRGRYSVIVSPGSGSLLQFNASVKRHRVGKVLSPDQPVDLSFGIGEAERLTFDASAGDTVALRVASVATSPAGRAVTIGVYRPDAGAITNSTTTYTTLAPTGTQIVNLPNLPVSGRYTVIVAPQYGLPAAVRLSLVSGSTGHVVSGAGAQVHGAHVPGQNIYLTFDATEREDLELSISGLSAVGGQSSSYTVNVYSVTGTQIFSTSCSASNPGTGCRLPLWYLPAGPYSVIVAPSGGAELHFATTLNDVRVGRELLPDMATNFTFGTAEAERVTFSASAGDSVSLQVSDLLTVPAGSLINVYVFRPDDGAIFSSTTPYVLSQPSGNKVINLPNLPVTGRYTVIVAPGYGLPGRATITMTRTLGNPVLPGAGTLPSDGLPLSQSAAAGQSVTMTFASVLGDNYELTLNHSTIGSGTAGSFYVNVLGPSGTGVASATCNPSDPGGGCRIPLWNLASGTYTVVVSSSNKSATLSFTAILRKETIEGNLERGNERDVSLSEGQVRRFTFDAALGDTVALRLSGIATTPAGRFVTVQIYRPDSGRILAGSGYASLTPTAYGTLNLPNLPVGGKYVAIVSSPFGIPATASLLLASGVSDIRLEEGISQAVATIVGGQNAYMTFDAARGDNLELAFSGTTVTGSSATNVLVQVIASNGTSVASFTCYSSDPTGSCRQPLWNLAPGSYTIVASAPNSASTIGFTAKLSRDLDSGQLVRDVAVDASLEQGQVKRFMFAASAGDTVALRLDGATLPAGRQITAQVYRPDGGAIVAGESYSSLPITVRGVLNLSDLPVSGNYSVVVSSAHGLPANATLTIASGAGGTILSPDITQQVATHIEGQNAYLDFQASYGDNMQISLSDTQVIGGASTSLNVNVFNPNGTNVASFTCAARIGASCRYPVWNLTKGEYHVIVSPADISAKLTFSALLRQEVVSGSVPRNQPIEVPLEIGQVKRLILDAEEGESLTVAVEAITSLPAGKAVTVQIFSPDDGQVLPGGAYKSVSASSSSTLSIPSLPASGSYLVIISATDGIPATVGISVTSP